MEDYTESERTIMTAAQAKAMAHQEVRKTATHLTLCALAVGSVAGAFALKYQRNELEHRAQMERLRD